MPRSKRNKIVSLTKTQTKGRSLKSKLVETLRNAVDEYESIFVFTFHNLRASKFKDVRLHFRESRIFMGKNSIAQIALGRTPEEEFKDNLRHISQFLTGDVGILFTSRDKDEVMDYFKDFSVADYAKAGAIPEEDVVIPEGSIPFASSMLDQFRKLGMVVEVVDGNLALRDNFVAAKAGEPLSPEQAKVLAQFDIKLINFTIRLQCYWNGGNYEEL